MSDELWFTHTLTAILSGFFSAVVTGVPFLYLMWKERKKSQAEEAERKNQDSKDDRAQSLNEILAINRVLQEETLRLRQRIDELESKHSENLIRIRCLESQLIQHGIQPIVELTKEG